MIDCNNQIKLNRTPGRQARRRGALSLSQDRESLSAITDNENGHYNAN